MSALRILGLLALGLAALYAVICGLVCVKQDRMLFVGAARRDPPRGPRHEPFSLDVGDGATIRGVIRRARHDGPAPVLLVFGGNADEATQHAAAGWPDDFLAVFVNYRGFGDSTGKPSQKALFADALALHDLIVARPDADPRRVLVWGTSLGSGVATYVASRRPVAHVVLFAPYDSIEAVASRHFGFLPVSLLLRHRFPSISYAPAIDAPVVAFAGTRDALIPPAHSEALLAAWKGPHRLVRVEGADHNTIAGREVDAALGQVFERVRQGHSAR